MNRIKYRKPGSSEIVVAKATQLRAWATVTRRVNEHYPSMAQLDRHMHRRGFVRAGKRWRSGIFSAGGQPQKRKPRRLPRVNFAKLYRQCRRKNAVKAI